MFVEINILKLDLRIVIVDLCVQDVEPSFSALESLECEEHVHWQFGYAIVLHMVDVAYCAALFTFLCNKFQLWI
jgi:hypothetical protein